MRFLPGIAILLLISSTVQADKLLVAVGADAKLDEPFGVGFDKAGNMFIIEIKGRLLKVDPQGSTAVVAGALKKGYEGDGGPAAKALFNGPHHLLIAPNDDILIADTWNNCVRKIDGKTGVITTIAGTGKKGFSGDGGQATKADSGGIYSVALDARGEKLYLCDLDNRRIRVVELSSGTISTIAGNGQKGVPSDGSVARDSPLVDPRAVAVDAKGNVYILERIGNALRVMTPDGKIKTVAGTGKQGATGDGGDASEATLNGPKHLCIDLDGNVLIADAENNLVRKYLPAQGKMVRVAGTGSKGTSGTGGPPEKAELARPHGVYLHPSGVLYITDSYNNRIVKIDR